jgi:hypothetical protein
MSYVVQACPSFGSWTALSTNTAAADGTFQYTDPALPGATSRFYRTVRLVP